MADSNLTKKLQIRQGITLLIINSPDEFKSQFSELKFDSEKSKKKSVLYDYLHIFVNNKSDLEKFGSVTAAAKVEKRMPKETTQ